MFSGLISLHILVPLIRAIESNKAVLQTSLLYLTFIALGYLICGSKEYRQGLLNLPESVINTTQLAHVEINSFAKTGRYHTVEARIVSIEGIEMTHGYIPVKALFDTTFSTVEFYPGRQCMAEIILRRPRPNLNPHGFDYRGYLWDQGIIYQAFIQKDKIYWKNEASAGFRSFIHRLRSSITLILNRYFKDEVLGIMSALLLGTRSFLDADIQESFANAGAIHVLAVSGLHVGIITYGLLFFLRRLFPGSRRFRPIRILFLFSFLYIYCQVTGELPPVERAAIMFAIFAFATELGIGHYPINTLAFTAFILLAINPFILFQVSFQLSYTAVISILLFYKHVVRLISFRSALVQYLWQMMALSIAAQILTLPLTVYYFHQIPVYFILSSMIGILLVQGLLIGGFALIISESFIPILSKGMAALLSCSASWLCQSIHLINLLPLSHIEGLYLSGPLLWLLYAIIFWITLITTRYTYKRLICLLIAVLIFSSGRLFKSGINHFQNCLVVYENRYSSIELIKGHSAIHLYDPRMAIEQARNMSRPNHQAHRVFDICFVDMQTFIHQSTSSYVPCTHD